MARPTPVGTRKRTGLQPGNRITSRPKDAPESSAIDITDLSEQEQNKITTANARAGLELMEAEARRSVNLAKGSKEAEAAELKAKEEATRRVEIASAPPAENPALVASQLERTTGETTAEGEIGATPKEFAGQLGVPLFSVDPGGLLKATESEQGRKAAMTVTGLALAGGGLASTAPKILSKIAINAKTLIGGGVLTAGGILGKVGVYKRQEVKKAKQRFTDSKRVMNDIINFVNGGGDRQTALEMWSRNLAVIRASERELKALTDNSLESFISGGGEELSTVSSFLTDDLRLMSAEFATALAKPDPSKIKAETETGGMTDEILA